MKSKKIISLVLASVLTMSMLAGCGEKASTPEGEKSDKLKVTLLGAGYGDKSFWDSAKTGVEQAGETYKDKIEINVVDMSPDTKKWNAAMHEAGESDADLIITGGFQQIDNMYDIIPQYTDKKWIGFDTALDYSKADLENVYTMGYMANQSGYLAGMTAAYMTTSKNEGINEDKVVGFVGGMENTPIVGDFLVGYIEGIKAVDPEIKVITSYVNSFEDSAKGKEIALSQFNSKADVVFSVAGAAGTGCIEAAANVGKYVIGVDSDQSLLYEGRPEQKHIVTSALKKVDESIVYSIGRALEEKLPYGTYEVLGAKENAIGLVYNDIFKSYVDEDFQAKLKAAEEDLKADKIKVTSAFDMTNDEIKELADSVRPGK